METDLELNEQSVSLDRNLFTGLTKKTPRRGADTPTSALGLPPPPVKPLPGTSGGGLLPIDFSLDDAKQRLGGPGGLLQAFQSQYGTRTPHGIRFGQPPAQTSSPAPSGSAMGVSDDFLQMFRLPAELPPVGLTPVNIGTGQAGSSSAASTPKSTTSTTTGIRTGLEDLGFSQVVPASGQLLVEDVLEKGNVYAEGARTASCKWDNQMLALATAHAELLSQQAAARLEQASKSQLELAELRERHERELAEFRVKVDKDTAELRMQQAQDLAKAQAEAATKNKTFREELDSTVREARTNFCRDFAKGLQATGLTESERISSALSCTMFLMAGAGDLTPRVGAPTLNVTIEDAIPFHAVTEGDDTPDLGTAGSRKRSGKSTESSSKKTRSSATPSSSAEPTKEERKTTLEKRLPIGHNAARERVWALDKGVVKTMRENILKRAPGLLTRSGSRGKFDGVTLQEYLGYLTERRYLRDTVHKDALKFEDYPLVRSTMETERSDYVVFVYYNSQNSRAAIIGLHELHEYDAIHRINVRVGTTTSSVCYCPWCHAIGSSHPQLNEHVRWDHYRILLACGECRNFADKESKRLVNHWQDAGTSASHGCGGLDVSRLKNRIVEEDEDLEQ